MQDCHNAQLHCLQVFSPCLLASYKARRSLALKMSICHVLGGLQWVIPSVFSLCLFHGVSLEPGPSAWCCMSSSVSCSLRSPGTNWFGPSVYISNLQPSLCISACSKSVCLQPAAQPVCLHPETWPVCLQSATQTVCLQLANQPGCLQPATHSVSSACPQSVCLHPATHPATHHLASCKEAPSCGFLWYLY